MCSSALVEQSKPGASALTVAPQPKATPTFAIDEEHGVNASRIAPTHRFA